jgi:hypothetical protein
MRQGASNRRLRNRGGNGGQKKPQHNKNRVYDSSGPDVRIRGTAFQIAEKYDALAKDAASAGDRVLAESYLQHAEHYQRIINSWAIEMDTNETTSASQSVSETESLLEDA